VTDGHGCNINGPIEYAFSVFIAIGQKLKTENLLQIVGWQKMEREMSGRARGKDRYSNWKEVNLARKRRKVDQYVNGSGMEEGSGRRK
jgi:hypothetical protein